LSHPVSPAFDNIGVIVGRDLVGDALMKLPFLRALRNAFPDAAISWITSQGPTAFAAQLLEPTQGLIDKIYQQPDWLQTYGDQPAVAFGAQSLVTLFQQFIGPFPAAESQKPDTPFFDLLIDTRNRWREAIYARLVPHKLFLAPAMHYLFSEKRPAFLGSRPDHICDRLLDLVELAAGYRPPSTGALPVPDEVLQKARRILPEGKTYIGLAPGAGYIDKAWPRFKFEKIAFAQAQKGRVPVFILGPQELSWYDELQATVPDAKFPLQEYDLWGNNAITIDHTLAIGRLLDVAVANDSGVGHMLAAADCALISLFGPTNPEKLAPRVTNGMVIKAQQFGSSHMRAIPTEEVDGAIEAMLAKKTESTSR
jgi:ADP-heptose:LPS heptosyltransferase